VTVRSRVAELPEQVEQAQDVVVVDVAEDRDIDAAAGTGDVDEDRPEGRFEGPAGAAIDEDPARPAGLSPFDDEAIPERSLEGPQPETGTPIPQRATSAQRSKPAPSPNDRSSR
jgi:hypothetical protein